jgi:hypothetical protein
MMDVPAVTPVTNPVVEFTVALALLLLQEPPGVPSVAVMDCPAHTEAGPPIGPGVGFTVTVVMAVQPPAV